MAETNVTQSYILEINNLTVLFQSERGEKLAVENVSFKVPKGETLGIVGESGSGKSVTALSILGLLGKTGRAVAGEILFHSPTMGTVDLLKLSPFEMRQIRGGEIAMIFQEPQSSLNPVYTCGNQIMEAILQHEKVSLRAARSRAFELLVRVRLKEPKRVFKAYPHELSGGQKQRVMIAIALACNPSVIIADEPTTALDVTVQHYILEIMQDLREDKDTSIIFITHDLSVVGEIADRVMVMYSGQKVEEGTVWDIFSKPQHPYTKGLLACRPRMDIKLKVLPVVSDFMLTNESGSLSEISETRFQSVGQAIMLNFQSINELKEKHHKLIQQEPILKVENLSVWYPKGKTWWGKILEKVNVVDQVSFEVYPGETLGLVGESGCGKSTLGRTIMQLVRTAEGKIWFEGENILEMSPQRLREIRKDIQIIFQDPYASLNPKQTIGEAIIEPMRLHNIGENDRERLDSAIELLETVGMSGTYINRYPHEFSGGQRQRICIARALAIKPKFVICDESVSALDVSVQSHVLNLLNLLKQKYNLTYIFISHDMAVIKFISDRVMVMNEGRIEEIQFGEDLYKHPQKEYTKELIQAIPKGSLDDIRKAMIKRKMAKKDNSANLANHNS